MAIRDATESDLAHWSAMRTALWPDTNDAHLSEIKEYFSGASIDIVQAYIAELAGEPVGFLELNLRSFAEGSRQPEVPYVEGWYVKPAHRGRGIGKQLMQRAEQWAISRGYSELASDTDMDNPRSIAMHKHLGFAETARVVCFLKSLKGV